MRLYAQTLGQSTVVGSSSQDGAPDVCRRATVDRQGVRETRRDCNVPTVGTSGRA